MGESPIYTCTAHVFTIDPKTKKTWLPASNQGIKVSFFFDKSREQYRILSIDDTAQDPTRKMPINSIMTEKMSFKKTSQKFGQWADTNSGTVYGLGFTNEAELDRFVEQFCQALDHTRRLRKQQPQPSHQVFGGGGGGSLSAEYEQPMQQQHSQSGGENSLGSSDDVERLAAQLQQANLNMQKLERENQALRAGARAPESDVRVAQLEKENFMLKTRIKQLEDTVTQLDQQLKDAPALASELQRRLHEAGDLAAQLVKSTAAGGGHGKY
ncbi:hypothetical protein BOX15_Mlig019815g1 [Macrostomum lignano]|uniref:WH1 domain-containing protein n=2 Tax=Macrostomum lignano TaxID=282301 RepID=A0A1I8H257_9PLAT|nr:hypothetical protein BOX15_Mlig019815g1 [Macrostomum lignano]